MRYLLLAILCLPHLFSFGQDPSVVPGELIVQFAPNSNPELFLRKFETEHKIGIESLDVLSDIVNIYHIKFNDKAINLDRALQLFDASPEINIAQKNHLIQDRETIPIDPLFASGGWHLKNTGLDGGEIDADIDATDAWDIATGGVTTHNDTIVVCVIEGSGVDITHEDLVDNIWRNYGEIPDDGIDNDGNGYVDDYEGWNVQSEDDAIGFGGHGTKVAGLIGAKGNNDLGLSGVIWDVKMMIIKGQTTTNEATIIAAYSYPLTMRKLYNETFGEKGAFVVVTNSSWGKDGEDPADHPLWCAMYDSLGAQGVLNVGATTNDNVNVDVVGDMPTNCTSDYFIGVTATNNVDVRPGYGYGATSIDMGVPGFGMRMTSAGDTYGSGNGTSFAAPVLSGAIALAYATPCGEFMHSVKNDPAAAALQMKDYFLNGVDPVPALVDDVGTGGRLNVKNAMDLLLDDCDIDACIPPYNLRGIDLSDNEATVVWEGFTSNYILSIQPDGGEIVEIPIIDATSFDFDTLIPCTNYTFTLRADCEDDVFSEESFSVTFTTDGCCTNPPLANTDKTENTLTISWDDVLYATQYNFRYSETDSDEWTELTDVTAPIVIEALGKCTEYEFQIYTLCADSTRGFSESTIFRTLGCGPCTELEYCSVPPANTNLEWIDSVKINGFENQTGSNDGWLRSNQIITALTPGESYEITVVPDFAESSFTERYSIYIDFDQNGEFNTPVDRVLDDYSYSGSMTTSFTIPPGAAIGVTKLRIAMAPLINPIACQPSSFIGEYEDYCVYIGPQLGVPEESFNISIYPNPANDQIFIESDVQINQIEVYSYEGKKVYTLNDYNDETIDISNLSPGIYIVQIETTQGVLTEKVVKQ